MTNRIKIRLGDAEFEAEGTAESVESQYERFLAALDRRTASPASPANPIQPGKPAAASGNGQASFDESLLTRIFELRGDGVVALRALPKGESKEADAFLLLLLGYRRLKNEEHVLATQLLKAASYSGVSSYRPAHALSQYDGFIIRGGQKKGTSYALNNPGVAKAEEIAAQIFK